MKQKKFCHFCGFPLEYRFLEGQKRLYCIACKEPLYENPIPASCCVVTNDTGEILLVKRSVEPKIGMWCLPGGFMELGETHEEAALRELEEETGIKGKISDLLGVMAHPSLLYGSVAITGFWVENFSGQPFPGDDASDCAFFAYKKLPEVAFRAHMAFIRTYIARYVS